MAIICEGQKIEIFKGGKKKDLVPRIKSTRRVSFKKQPNDEPQTFDIANIEFYVFADQRLILNHKIRKIEVFLSKRDLKYYRQKYTPFDEIDHKNQKDVNDTLFDYSYAMHDLISAHLNGIYKIGRIDPQQKIRRRKRVSSSGLRNQSDNQLFGTRKIYRTTRRRKNSKFDRRRSGNLEILNERMPEEEQELLSESYGRKFKRQYRRAIKKGVDPMVFLQDRDHYVCVEESVKGVSKINKPRRSPLRHAFTRYAQSSYRERNSLNFRIEEIEVSNRIARLKARVRMNSLMLAGLFSSGFEYLIFFAYDKEGNRIDSHGYQVDLQKMFDDFINPLVDFDISTSKDRERNAITRIFNGEFRAGVYNLYQKRFSLNSSPLRSDYEKVETNVAEARSAKRLINGVSSPNNRVRGFCSTKNVFQRVTFNHLGTELSNSKASSVRAFELPDSKVNCKIYAQIDNLRRTDRIKLTLYDFTEEVSSFQIVRRRVRGNRGSNFEPIQFLRDGQLTDIPRIIIRGTPNESYTFYDIDVEDEELYEYAAILYDASGVSSLSDHKFIEEYLKRDGILRVTMRSGPARPMPPGDLDRESATIHQKFKVTIKKVEDDIDKVINSLFGDNRVLFNEDLKEIREGSNLNFGVRVHRIDKHTGRSTLLGVFRASKQKSKNESANSDLPKDYQLTFTDRIPAYSKQIYKIEPYAVPPAQILDRLVEKLKYTAAKDLNKRSALTKMLYTKGRVVNKDMVSKVGGKYSSQTTKKGSIASDLAFAEISRGDIFTEGYTGDVHYHEHASMSRLRPFSDLKFEDSKVSQFYALDIEQRENRKISKNFMKVSFTAGFENSLVDFYVILRAENNNPKLVIDGVVHSKDNFTGQTPLFSYDYLSEIKTKVGYISYFAIAISKTGNLSNLLPIGNIYLRD